MIDYTRTSKTEWRQIVRPITKAGRVLGVGLLALGLFAAGYVAGQARFGQPKTIIHVVEIKWSPGVSDADKQRVLEGVKEVAAKVPGVKNVWLKADRLEPRDFNAAFAIEFQNRAAADAYAESSAHDNWDQHYVPLRAASVSIQVTNP
jgi:Stress responsive A/B Barrel Domain